MFLLALAARLLLVDAFTSQVPFWDQWLDDAPLYRSIVLGELTWGGLVQGFHEHRILWSRLWRSGMFLLNNQQWDAQVEPTWSAFLGAAIPVLLLALLGRIRGSDHSATAVASGSPISLTLAGVVCLIWLSPTLWYNITWGFQSAFYFLTLFSVAGISLVHCAPAWSLRWFAGGLCLASALLSLGSGALASGALVGYCVLVCIRERKFARSIWPTVALGAALMITGQIIQHGLHGPTYFKVRNVSDLMGALVRNLSFPWSLESREYNPAGILLWVPAPALILLWLWRAQLWEKLRIHHSQWAVFLTLCVWVYGQLILTAFFRGGYGTGPGWRHYDLHAIGLFINAVAVRLLFPALLQHAITRMQYSLIVTLLATLALLSAIFVSGIAQQSLIAATQLNVRPRINAAQITNMRGYLATGDPAHITNKRFLESPFGDLKSPEKLLDDPIIRRMLPPAVRDPLTLTPVPQESGRPYRPGAMPPYESAPPFRRVWTSWIPELEQPDHRSSGFGRGVWQLPATSYPYLAITYFGEFSPDSAPIIATRGTTDVLSTHLVNVEGARPFSWTDTIARTPKGEGLLHVQETAPDAWLAIVEPVEMGRLTYWSQVLRRNAIVPIVLGTFLLAYGLAAAFCVRQPAR